MIRVLTGPPTSPLVVIPNIAAATAMVAAPDTPAFSKSGAKARPVAGPPVRVTEPLRTPNRGWSPKGRAMRMPRTFWRTAKTVAAEEEPDDLGPADLEQADAGPEPDGREESDHQRIAERRVELKEGRAGPAGDERQEGDDEAADDRCGDVVSRQRLDELAQPISEEQDDSRKSDRVDQVEFEHERLPENGRGDYSTRKEMLPQNIADWIHSSQRMQCVGSDTIVTFNPRVWSLDPGVRVHPVTGSQGEHLQGSRQAAPVDGPLCGAWQRPADLPILRDKRPDLLPVEEPV